MPWKLPDMKAALTWADGEIIPSITIKEEIKDAQEVKIEMYGDKLLNCDNKYSQAFITIWLNFEDSL